MSTLIRGLGRLFLILALGAIGTRLWAQQPPLTTIRDTVYRADGTPFNGLVLIEWKTFQASNNANIGAQGATVKVVNGNLYVRLTPTTTASNNAYYLVRYNSDGQFQFSEIWAVPPSSAALKLRDVRAVLLPGGVISGGGAGGVIVGGDTVLPGFGDAETPSGAINGINADFTLTAAPTPAASLALFRNGVLQTAGHDYTLNSATISFSSGSIPQLDDTLEAFYRTAGSGGTSGGHALLGTSHTDTTPSNPARGGIIVGQGNTPTWAQLPLGPAGRCLTSNGTDAVWSPCLYTAFTPGSIPFADSAGNLAQNTGTLVYNNVNRRFSVGNNVARSTLNVWDSSSAGVTELTVRAGLQQGSVPMQTWISNAGQSLAFVNADGGFNVRRLLTNSTNTRPGFSDVGTPTDPAPGLLANGDSWYNTTVRARKSYEAGQIHSADQVACSNVGTSTTTSVFVELGTCTLPAGYLVSGDRLRIEATYLHLGGSTGAQIDILSGATTIAGRAVSAGDDVFTVSVSVGVGTDLAAWSAQTMGAATGPIQTVGQASFTPGGTFGPLKFRGRQLTDGTDSIRLVHFSVTRLPQQANP